MRGTKRTPPALTVSSRRGATEPMSRSAQSRRAPLWARLLPHDAPTTLSAALPLLAAPLATMGMAAVSSAPDLSALEPPPPSRSFVFGSSMRACAICLEEYLPGDRLRMLEPCAHCFHQGCIDRWLRVSECARRDARVCPVCNVALVAPFHHREHVDALDEQLNSRPPWPTVQLIDVSPNQSWVEWFTDLLKLYYPHGNSRSSSASSP